MAKKYLGGNSTLSLVDTASTYAYNLSPAKWVSLSPCTHGLKPHRVLNPSVGEVGCLSYDGWSPAAWR